MKGIVFTEFLEHAEQKLGPVGLERLIDSCALPSGGVYTAVGTYPCAELGQLIGALAQSTGVPTTALIQDFGEHLAAAFLEAYPQYFATPSFFDFIESIDKHIHVEVLKLYPDAELPQFRVIMRTGDAIVIDYISSRGLDDLAYGLLRASAAIFGEQVEITSCPQGDAGVRIVRFRIERLAHAS